MTAAGMVTSSGKTEVKRNRAATPSRSSRLIDRSDERSTRDKHQTQFDALVAKQRKYFQLVKLYQQECQKNEELSSTGAAP